MDPPELTLLVAETKQLNVSCLDTLGLPTDVTSPDSGTTYASDDETIATVDANGVVTSVNSGSTEIRVTNGDVSAVVPVNVVKGIDLGDLVAGGDGTGLGGGPNGNREFWGLDPDTGVFLTQEEIESNFGETSNQALDYNDTNTIDISDPIANLTHQFLGGPPPEEPGKESCGPDPTDDELDCEGYPEEHC